MVDDNEGDIVLARECCALSHVTNPWVTFSSGADLFALLGPSQSGRSVATSIGVARHQHANDEWV